MKKSLFIALIISILAYSCSQEHRTNQKQLNAVIEYGKIWGFLKYYHPNVATGKINWDSVFVTQIRRINNIDSKNQYNEEIRKLLQTAGKSTYYSDTITTFTDSQLINYDFKWLEKSKLLKRKNKSELLYIRNYHKPASNYYVQYPYDDNPYFENEDPYEEMAYPNKEYRLLSLFRYWNVINYYFPYKYLMDEDWSDAPSILIDDFITAKDTLEYHLAIYAMASKLNDTHAIIMNNYIYQKLGYHFFPVGFGYINGKTFVSEIFHDSLAIINNLQVGDIIKKINGISIDVLRDSIGKFVSASNEAVMNREVNKLLGVGKEGHKSIIIIRNGKELQVKVNNYYEFPRLSLWEQKHKQWCFLENKNIGYINMGMVYPDNVAHIMSQLMNTKTIIFDVRNYPNDTLYEFCKFLLSHKVPFVKGFFPVIGNPGIYHYGNNLYTGPENINANYYKGKIIILVNEETQSHAEFTVMSLQSVPESVILGNQTAGADGNCSILFLPGNINTRFSGVGIYYPDNSPTQRIGIVPDIYFNPNIDEFEKGKDLMLEEAIRLAKNYKKNKL